MSNVIQYKRRVVIAKGEIYAHLEANVWKKKWYMKHMFMLIDLTLRANVIMDWQPILSKFDTTDTSKLLKKKFYDETELLNYVLKLKEKNINFQIEWRLKEHARPFKPGDKFCSLYNAEKTAILFLQIEEKA